MSRVNVLIDRYKAIMETVEKGDMLKLSTDVGNIPRNTIVDVVDVIKKGGKYQVKIMADDGEKETIVLARLDKMPHEVVS